MAEQKTYTPEEAKTFEDNVMKDVADWNDEKKATVYTMLYAEGMRLDKARAIRRKAKLTQ